MLAKSFTRLLAVALAVAVFPASAADFDYYLLSLSYAPNFCAQPTGNKDPRECGSGRRVGFIVHGLWPQSQNGRGPERCSPARPVSRSLVQLMLTYIPSDSLIQHEWTNHGTCSGLSAADYFAAVRKARDSVKIPDDLKQPAQQIRLRPSEIEAKFAAANPVFPPEAFRVSCYRDGELQEARICLSKDLSPRACTASAGACPAETVTILPVR
jgi:ribonuclease T2